MERERALEIERVVIYGKINSMPKNIDAQSAFEVGMMIGRMHQALRYELEKETESEE